MRTIFCIKSHESSFNPVVYGAMSVQIIMQVVNVKLESTEILEITFFLFIYVVIESLTIPVNNARKV